jgi:hypothetical protein
MQFALQTPDFLARLFPRPATGPASRVTRRSWARVSRGTTQEIARPGKRITVHCRDGQAWITHDGDPRDVLLQAAQSYTADRADRMTLHALEGDCLLEIEVDL